MEKKLLAEDIEKCITAYISKNLLWADKTLEIFYIINPTAGCFNKKSKSEHYKKIFVESLEKIESKKSVVKEMTVNKYVTDYAGHAKEIANEIVDRIIQENDSEKEYMIVTAGGDGTSLEVQTRLFILAQESEIKEKKIKNQITILRLPLGTGNDGTDGHKIEETIDLLSGDLRFENATAVKVYPEKNVTKEQILSTGYDPKKYNKDDPQYPWYAFNIVSVGLDAFVVYMTNTMKQKVPGNFYQICVPLSGFVYDRKPFESGLAKMEFFDGDGKLVYEEENPITIFVFGASGHRYYGGGHYILPTDDNVCHAPKITLGQLIKVNPQFIDGSFVGGGIAYLHSAKKVRFSYDKLLLLQCDGEVAFLCKDHFPLIFEVTEPTLRTIQKINKA